ncbi:polyprenyl synthetase family protein [Streptomyces jeddahensis]|uniref:(2E,6E)-farnesyl diphosphate synthase n=1 Tax=Streptomyces jeddahensis TaxID=1716141 RepID=A0A177HK02_9ACTN|nr:polyprenyl synthetase family protein [Streptomyces jeddahensis]OAH11255.1 (2E,6E)-farnesyl diphosphate synthase [Streptomyces jeddahensis]
MSAGIQTDVIDFPADSAFSAERADEEPGMRELYERLSTRWDAEDSLLGDMCRHAQVPMGKLFRPVLLLESALAVGGDIAHVLPAAVGTESGHVASLVHDDIIDNDLMRRGRPAVHAKFGADNAIVAGDAMLFDLFRCLAECRQAGAQDSRIVSALEVVAKAGLELCRGQSLEYEITQGSSRDVDRYILMIKLKTGALFRGACQAGALLGGGGRQEIEALGTYGDELGIAFQMCDDLFAYTGDDDTAIGKSLLSDIRNKRMTLPVLLAYQQADRDGERLLDAAFDPELDPAEALAMVGTVIRRTGAVEASRAMALRHASAAERALDALVPTPSRHRMAHHARMAVSRVS